MALVGGMIGSCRLFILICIMSVSHFCWDFEPATKLVTHAVNRMKEKKADLVCIFFLLLLKVVQQAIGRGVYVCVHATVLILSCLML